jgi:glycine hydroxymethyltransferase
MAAYYAVLEPGDTILSLSVDHGGHLSHGQAVNFSGRYYRIHHYALDRDTELLDYESARKTAQLYRPKLIVVGFSAYSRIIDWEAWRAVADDANALLMADIAHIVGLIAAGAHPSPIPHADIVTSTTHKTLRGPRGAFIMCKRHLADAIDRAIFPGIQAGPLMHVIAAKAVAFREAMTEGFRAYQLQIVKNARALAAALQGQGVRIVSGGTDNHLMLCDLRPLTISGRDAANMLEEAGIIVNKNSIPYDHQPPAIASGIRPGTPAITTRGMKEPEMAQIGEMMGRVLRNPLDREIHLQVREEVRQLCARFPVYDDLGVD